MRRCQFSYKAFNTFFINLCIAHMTRIYTTRLQVRKQKEKFRLGPWATQPSPTQDYLNLILSTSVTHSPPSYPYFLFEFILNVGKEDHTV